MKAKLQHIKSCIVLYVLARVRDCIILYSRFFKPTVKNVIANPFEEQAKLSYYNEILTLNHTISQQKQLIIDLQDRKDFLERTLIRLKTSVEQSEERDQMILHWEKDLIDVDSVLEQQHIILQNIMLDYVRVKEKVNDNTTT